MTTSIAIQPTSENLERYKAQLNGVTYWKTSDFFPYDEQHTALFNDLLISDQEALENSFQEISTVLNISVENLKQQFDNYSKVKQTPFCIWQIDPISGKQKPTFFTSLDALIAENRSSSKPNGVLGKFFNISKQITPWIWATVVVIVLIPMIGQWFMVRSFASDPNPPKPVIVQDVSSPPNVQMPQPALDWNQFEHLVKDKMRKAHVKTEAFARNELDEWADTLTQRLDDSFLDWYFGYFHQKQLEYTSFFTGISGKFQQWLDPSKPSPQEKIAEEITKEFQEEFAKRVLVPQVSEFQLQNITLRTAKSYLREIGQEFNQIPIESGVSAADWDRYLNETSIAIPSTEGNLVALPLKQMTTAGAYVALKPLIVTLLPKVGSTVVGQMATKVGAKLAVKTGGVLSAKLGGTLLDATVGVGIILWDIWDVHHTANIEKPILRENLIDYIAEVEESVLNNPTNGIMTVTEKIDNEILRSIRIVKDAQVSFAGSNS